MCAHVMKGSSKGNNYQSAECWSEPWWHAEDGSAVNSMTCKFSMTDCCRIFLIGRASVCIQHLYPPRLSLHNEGQWDARP